MWNPLRRAISSVMNRPSNPPRTPLPQATFAVHDVKVATQLLPETGPKAAVELLVGGPVEACSDYRGTLIACRFHPLVAATWAAFDDHRPLSLSPDVIWLTIAQGLAIHINQNAEALRRHFVAHEGRSKLSVRRDDFVKGSPENPWDEVIGEFSRQIEEQIGEKHGWIVSDFSTTGKAERVASEVVLMDAMQSYRATSSMSSLLAAASRVVSYPD